MKVTDSKIRRTVWRLRIATPALAAFEAAMVAWCYSTHNYPMAVVNAFSCGISVVVAAWNWTLFDL